MLKDAGILGEFGRVETHQIETKVEKTFENTFPKEKIRDIKKVLWDMHLSRNKQNLNQQQKCLKAFILDLGEDLYEASLGLEVEVETRKIFEKYKS